MKKQNKKILLVGIIIIGLVGAMLFVSSMLNKTTEVNCFPEGNYLCENSTLINGYFYCNLDDIKPCPNGCKVTKIGDDFCIK